MANRHRGQYDFEIGGEQLYLEFTPEVIMALDAVLLKMCGQGAAQLVNAGQGGTFLFMYQALLHGLGASYREKYGRPLKLDQVMAWVQAERKRMVEIQLCVIQAFGAGANDPESFEAMERSLEESIAEARGESPVPFEDSGEPAPEEPPEKEPEADEESETLEDGA